MNFNLPAASPVRFCFNQNLFALGVSVLVLTGEIMEPSSIPFAIDAGRLPTSTQLDFFAALDTAQTHPLEQALLNPWSTTNEAVSSTSPGEGA